MSTAGIVALGAVAGFTIFLGLPIARLRGTSVRLKAFLNAAAAGVLLFLLWDVLSSALEPVESALAAASAGRSGWAPFAGAGAVFCGCLIVGFGTLVVYEDWMARRSQAANRPVPVGPGAMAFAELAPRNRVLDLSTPSRRLALLIAVGIGLHNFSEGLAIGQSAATGAVGLAVLLIVGFALHNATEGFGITAPMSGEDRRPSWLLLGLLGLIGGGPTFIGTIIGQSFASDTVYLAFLALAAGSILYVIIQLVGAGLKMGHKRMLYAGLVLGLLVGFATDLVIEAAGA